MFNGSDSEGKASNSGGGKRAAEPSAGKGSAVHEAQTGEKRGAEDELGPGKRNKTDGFHFRINPEVAGSFAHDSSAAVSNPVHSTAQGLNAQATAYIGNVISVGRGKDKTPAKVAKQYAEEAFDNPADASRRFALVVGVNRMESVTNDGAAAAGELDAQLGEVAGFQQFPLTAFRKLWRPQWLHDGGEKHNQPASFDEVRAAAADHQAEADAAERGEKMPPVGPMRTETTKQPATARYTQELRQHFGNVYVHVGDADAVNLKAKADPNAQNQQATGLFNRYDQVLDEQHAQGKNPAVVSGGYRFRVKNDQLPADQQHADPNAGTAAKVSKQTAAGADLDMAVRQGLASHDPSSVYMPEPNMLVRSDVALQDGFNFGGTNVGESKAAINSIMPPGAKPQPVPTKDGSKKKSAGRLASERDAESNRAQGVRQPWARDNLVFDSRAALYTDGGRFETDTTQQFGTDQETGPGYGRGGTDVDGLTHPKRNAQSIARKRELGNAISQMNSNIGDILEVYLPQQLMTLSRQKGAANQTTLDAVRRYLHTYEVIAAGIESQLRAIVADEAADKIKPTGNPSGPALASAKDKLHETQPPALKELAAAAYDDPKELAERLAKAISSVKSAMAAKREVDQIDRLFAMAKAAAIQTAKFLAGFYPEAAPPPAQQIQQLQAAQPPPHAQGGQSPNAMQLD